MKYIYTNVTNLTKSVLLATKNQDSVGVRIFAPNTSLELDYPGLNLYVPNVLSCMVIDTTAPILEPNKEKISSVPNIKAKISKKAKK